MVSHMILGLAWGERAEQGGNWYPACPVSRVKPPCANTNTMSDITCLHPYTYIHIPGFVMLCLLACFVGLPVGVIHAMA